MNPTRLWASFAKQVEERPRATALVWHGEEISYAELHRLACRAHATIEQRHPADHEIIGMPATKSPRTIAVVLACLRAGRPIVLPSATLPASTLERLFAQAGCRHVVCSDDILPADDRLDDGLDGTPTGNTVRPAPAPARPPGDTAFVLTTSGSTGLPKLVPLSVGAVERFADWACTQFDIGPLASVLNYAPLNFDLCFLDVWTTLHRGGRVVLVDPDAAASGEHLLGLIADHEVNLVQAVPMFYRLLVDAAGDRPLPLDSVEHAAFTGDHMPPRLLARLPELFPGARLYNIYGCTETNDSFLYEIDPADMPPSAVPLGTPLPGVQTLIAGDDGDVVTGAGRGELMVATPFQTAGYVPPAGHVDDAQNTAKFVDHPTGDGVLRYFRTGDIMRRDADGQVHLEGRNDFQVKVRGTRVNTAEVEQALLAHDAVLEAAVVAVPDPLAGHLLHSVVRRAPAARLNSLDLRQHCAERLPPAAVPSTLRLVDEPLPKTSTGKVDRKLFDHLITIPAPTHHDPAPTAREEITR